MTDALLAGLLAGYGIAMPVGAMSVLIVTLSARTSLKQGIAAAMGVATADGAYALIAALGGAALSRLITPAARYLEIAAAGVLALIAVKGAVSAARNYGGETRGTQVPAKPNSPWRTYTTLVGLTLLNPVTVVYFAALVVGRQSSRAPSLTSGLVFVLAAFAASASWQTMLATGGALLRRAMTGPRGRLATALIGNTVILLLAAQLAYSAR